MSAKEIVEELSGERFSIEEVRDLENDITGLRICAQWPYADALAKLVRDFMIVNGGRVAREERAKYQARQEKGAAEAGFSAAHLQSVARKAYEDASEKPGGKPS